MFFLMSETKFASYADDNTPYVASGNVDVSFIAMSFDDKSSAVKMFTYCI